MYRCGSASVGWMSGPQTVTRVVSGLLHLSAADPSLLRFAYPGVRDATSFDGSGCVVML